MTGHGYGVPADALARNKPRYGDPLSYETGRFAEVDDEALDGVRTHLDVAAIVDQMSADLRQHPDEWENHTLERFLDALAATLGALDSLHHNRDEVLPDPPTWKVIAEALVIASGYE